MSCDRVKTTDSSIEPWPEDGLEHIETCPICGSTKRDLMYEGLTDRTFRCAPGAWDLYRCLKCESGYLNPRPTPETIGLAYSKYYTHATTAQEAASDLGPLRWLRRALANGYRNARFGTDYKPSSRLGVWAARLLPQKRAVLEAEGRHLPRPTPESTLLDVGCGNGKFLDLARAMGWKVEGLDIDAKAVEIAQSRGLEAHQGGIEALNGETNRFNVITLSHVIEHVHDPVALLKACHRLLKPDGLLWLETPNLESFGHAYYGRYWRDLDPPRHLVLFSWRSMKGALDMTDFFDIEPLQWRPLCELIYSQSEAMERGLDPMRQPVHSIKVLWNSWRANKRAESEIEGREFITVLARKKI